MSVLQKNHDFESEAANFNNTNCVGDGNDVKETVLNSGISKEQEVSNLSERSVDIESGVIKTRACLVKTDGDCRICHLSLENQESGVQFELGCSCKDDLAAAHKHCAETWFNIKGNRTCEICGSVAQNVFCALEAEHRRETNDILAMVTAPVAPSESRNSRKGYKCFIVLLMCIVCALVMSWRFSFRKHKSNHFSRS